MSYFHTIPGIMVHILVIEKKTTHKYQILVNHLWLFDYLILIIYTQVSIIFLAPSQCLFNDPYTLLLRHDSQKYHRGSQNVLQSYNIPIVLWTSSLYGIRYVRLSCRMTTATAADWLITAAEWLCCQMSFKFAPKVQYRE